MIGRRTWWEIFHVVLGVVAAAVIAHFASWSYPLARTDIWTVAIVAMVATTVMGVPPILRAAAADRAARLGG